MHRPCPIYISSERDRLACVRSCITHPHGFLGWHCKRSGSMKDKWSGTVVFIAQPAEEVIAGARMMLEDGLYKRFPKPDFALALHSDAQAPVGVVSFAEGLSLAASDTVDVIVKGKGGHGAAPHLAVDPIVLAAGSFSICKPLLAVR